MKTRTSILAIYLVVTAGCSSIGLQAGGIEDTYGVPKYIDIDRCPEWIEEWVIQQESQQQLKTHTCAIEVNSQKLMAYSTGSRECRFDTKLDDQQTSVVFRYRVKESSRLRFSGTAPQTCSQPATESPDCDFAKDPFFGLECASVTRGGLDFCRDCVRLQGATDRFGRPLPAACYMPVRDEEGQKKDAFDLVVNNVNFCSGDEEIALSYLIAVKAKDSTVVDRWTFHRVFTVDPTVIQEPRCPNGCDQQPATTYPSKAAKPGDSTTPPKGRPVP